MSTRDKIGVVILITLFVILGVVLVWVTPQPQGAGHDPGDSPIIQQRIIHLERHRD